MSSTSIDTDTITVLEVSFEGNNGGSIKNDSEISSSDPGEDYYSGEDEQDFPRNSGNFELNHDTTTHLCILVSYKYSQRWRRSGVQKSPKSCLHVEKYDP